jgi:type II secretory pathway component PulC
MNSFKRCALLTLCIAGLSANAIAADDAKESTASREELERKLDDAQERLNAAAREVAELSMSLSDGVMGPLPALPMRPNRAVLGIALAPRSSDRDDGVEVASVSPGGGAAQAGLKAGDVLVEMNGTKLGAEGERKPQDKLLRLMREVKPDEKVQVRYRRDGKLHDVEITARPLRDRFFTMALPAAGAHPFPGPLPGMAFFRAEGVFGSAELVPMTPKLGKYFGTDKGLLVVRAPDDSRLKLEEGDVILDIGGRTPSSPSHAFRILSSYQEGEKLKLNVMRDKKRLTFDITVPEAPELDHRMDHHIERGFGPTMRIRPGLESGASFEMGPPGIAPAIPGAPPIEVRMKDDTV